MCDSKVIAFICCLLTDVLLVVSTVTTEWIHTDGWKEGLFQQCLEQTHDEEPLKKKLPVPFGQSDLQPGCHRAHNANYVIATAGLVLLSCLICIFGTLLTGLGLRIADHKKRFKYFKVACGSLATSTLILVAALIAYPVSFSIEIAKIIEGRHREWSFGFGYGCAWAAFLLVFMALILLICDRDSQEYFFGLNMHRHHHAGHHSDDDDEDEDFDDY